MVFSKSNSVSVLIEKTSQFFGQKAVEFSHGFIHSLVYQDPNFNPPQPQPLPETKIKEKSPEPSRSERDIEEIKSKKEKKDKKSKKKDKKEKKKSKKEKVEKRHRRHNQKKSEKKKKKKYTSSSYSESNYSYSSNASSYSSSPSSYSDSFYYSYSSYSDSDQPPPKPFKKLPSSPKHPDPPKKKFVQERQPQRFIIYACGLQPHQNEIQSILAEFSKFGIIKSVQTLPKDNIALIEYSSIRSAVDAVESKMAVFNNEFIGVGYASDIDSRLLQRFRDHYHKTH